MYKDGVMWDEKMTPITLFAKSTVLFALTFGLTISFLLVNHRNPSPIKPDPMARSFVLWLHGLGDSGPANEPIKTFFTSPPFRNTKWSFPSAPSNPVTCNCKLLNRKCFPYCVVSVRAGYFCSYLYIFESIDRDWVIQSRHGVKIIAFRVSNTM